MSTSAPTVQSSADTTPAQTPSRRTRTNRRLRGRPSDSRAHQRRQPLIRARLPRTRRAQSAAEDDGGREDRDPHHHRRQGDSHRTDGEDRHAARSPARARRVPPRGSGARAAGDRRIGGRASRVGGVGLGGSGRGDSAGRGAPRHFVAPDDQRGDDAWPVEDGDAGRDRCRLRDDRLLAIQHVLRAGAVSRAADEQPRHVEPDGVPGARRASSTQSRRSTSPRLAAI